MKWIETVCLESNRLKLMVSFKSIDSESDDESDSDSDDDSESAETEDPIERLESTDSDSDSGSDSESDWNVGDDSMAIKSANKEAMHRMMALIEDSSNTKSEGDDGEGDSESDADGASDDDLKCDHSQSDERQ